MSLSPPSSSAAPADWFFSAVSDRDTQILTRALMHELSTPSACPILDASLESALVLPDSRDSLRGLHQREQKNQERGRLAAAAMAGSAAAPFSWQRQKGLALMEDGCLHVASPPSHSSLPTSNPGSPYSSVSTTPTTNSSMSIPTDVLFAHMKPAVQQECLRANALNPINSPSTSATADAFHPSSGSAQCCKEAAMALTSHGIRSKVGKKRSRASNRSPITFHTADVSNFRAMVQHLTGIPSVPSEQSYPSLSILKSKPVKNPYADTAGLPTLDTSAALLRCKPPLRDPLDGFSFARRNRYQLSGFSSSACESRQPEHNSCSAPSVSCGMQLEGLQTMLGDQSTLSSSSATLASLRNPTGDACLEGSSHCHVQAQQPLTKQETAQMDEILPIKQHHSAVDSWPFFDGVLASHCPSLEIARMA